MTMKEAYVKKLQAQLEQWDGQVDMLKAKAKEAKADAQLEIHKAIESLREQQRQAQTKLAELKGSGEGAWEDMKAGVENAWMSLGNAVNSAVARFR